MTMKVLPFLLAEWAILSTVRSQPQFLAFEDNFIWIQPPNVLFKLLPVLSIVLCVETL
jgi:hypothetical protein